ncbi:MAG: META domain-containing protein [Sphingobacteriales bacterium]|nr:MAG: META domain-containing protein [Sphingobacteriales bacterium]
MKKFGFLLFLIALVSISVSCYAGKRDMRKEKAPKHNTKKKAELEATHWSLTEIDGKPVASGDERIMPFIMFGKKGRLEGNTGCNSLGGTYDLGRFDAIKIEAVSTKMACPDMTGEAYMNNALSYANRYMINGRHLLLYNDNLLLALFEAKDAE